MKSYKYILLFLLVCSHCIAADQPIEQPRSYEPSIDHHYRALVVAVYDGDTITVDIELGLSVGLKAKKIRLHRINAPELRGEEREAGIRSRDHLRGLILGQRIVLETIKDKTGKYGRLLGEIWLFEDNGTATNINDALTNEGYAIYQTY